MRPIRSNVGASPDRFDVTLDSSRMEYDTGAHRMMMKQGSYTGLESIAELQVQHNGGPQDINQQKLYEQQFQNYQIKKMYNNETVSQFGSAETKLKQLHIKLKEAETAQARMKHESANLRKNLSQLSNIVPAELAEKISDLLQKIANDSFDNMEEHLKLRQKYNMV